MFLLPFFVLSFNRLYFDVPIAHGIELMLDRHLYFCIVINKVQFRRILNV